MRTAKTLRHLAALVASDTQNPPRNIRGDNPVFEHCRTVLGPSFEIKVVDHGSGHVSFYAIRGRPRALFNVHLDTVPAGTGWSSDPFELQVSEDRAKGRGACDIKGAAACLLALAENEAEHLALLFTTDEEGSEGKCVRAFCESAESKRFGQVIVAEPTGCQAVLGHRGFLAVEGRFVGTPGHSSESRALEDNAVHRMARWAGAALELAERENRAGAVSGHESGHGSGPSSDPGSDPSSSHASATCLNIGTVRGGTANNVIAGEAAVQWSARLRPGASNRDFMDSVTRCARDSAQVEWRVEHDGAPLPAGGQSDAQARDFAQGNGLTVAHDVDFWTEAAIFSEFGLPALVLGPGHIEQAHIVDEWVALSQLERARELYGWIIGNDG